MHGTPKAIPNHWPGLFFKTYRVQLRQLLGVQGSIPLVAGTAKASEIPTRLPVWERIGDPKGLGVYWVLVARPVGDALLAIEQCPMCMGEGILLGANPQPCGMCNGPGLVLRTVKRTVTVTPSYSLIGETHAG
jgi:hypothetical protein